MSSNSDLVDYNSKMLQEMKKEIFGILQKKAEKTIYNNAKSLLKDEADKLSKRGQLKEFLLAGVFLYELKSNDGYTLIWDRRIHGMDGDIDLTLISPEKKKILYVRHMGGYSIKVPYFQDFYNDFDEYKKIVSKLQFNEVKFIGDNSFMELISIFCKKNFGIEERDFNPKTLEYILCNPSEANLKVLINEKYMIESHEIRSPESVTIISCIDGDNKIIQSYGSCFSPLAKEITINLGDIYLQFITTLSSFEIAYADKSLNIQRKINLSKGDFKSSFRGELKEISLYDEKHELLHLGRNEIVDMTEGVAKQLVLHPEIKNFVLYAIDIIKNNYPYLGEKMLEWSNFSKSYMFIIDSEYEANDKVEAIINQTLGSNFSSVIRKDVKKKLKKIDDK